MNSWLKNPPDKEIPARQSGLRGPNKLITAIKEIKMKEPAKLINKETPQDTLTVFSLRIILSWLRLALGVRPATLRS